MTNWHVLAAILAFLLAPWGLLMVATRRMRRARLARSRAGHPSTLPGPYSQFMGTPRIETVELPADPADVDAFRAGVVFALGVPAEVVPNAWPASNGWKVVHLHPADRPAYLLARSPDRDGWVRSPDLPAKAGLSDWLIDVATHAGLYPQAAVAAWVEFVDMNLRIHHEEPNL